MACWLRTLYRAVGWFGACRGDRGYVRAAQHGRPARTVFSRTSGPAVHGGRQFLSWVYCGRVPGPSGGGHGPQVTAYVLYAESDTEPQRGDREFRPVGKGRSGAVGFAAGRCHRHFPDAAIPLPARPLTNRRRMTMKPIIALLACGLALAG